MEERSKSLNVSDIYHRTRLIRDWKQGKLAGFLKSLKHHQRIVTGIFAGSTIFRARFTQNRNAW